jgi:hypothetical protein
MEDTSMQGDAAETLQCVDCGKSAGRAPVSLHLGAVSAPSDEGHVRRTRIALCDRCADKRVAVQEPNFV